MSGREGVLDEPPLIETLDEPPIGNEACPQTSPNPDAVVLGGVPLDDETPAPGERAGTGTPSASSTPVLHGDGPSWARSFMGKDMHEDNTPFLNSNEQLSSAPGSSSSPRDTETPGLGDASFSDLTQEQTHAYVHRFSQANRFTLFNACLVKLSSVAVIMRFGSEGASLWALFWLEGCIAVYLAWIVLNFRYILPWLRRKHTELLKEDWRLSGTQARELSYQPTSWAVNIFGCSPTWRSWTRMLEHETDPLLIEIYTRRRSDDLSAQDTWYVVEVLSQYLVVCGALYYAISGRGLVWAIPSLVYFGVIIDFYLIALILRSHVRIRRYRGGYSQAGLDPL